MSEEQGESLQFREVEDLPEQAPSLEVNGVAVSPFAVDWRTGDALSVAPPDGLEGVARIQRASALDMELIGSATPSSFLIGVYEGSLDDIDPFSEPDETYECLEGVSCEVSTNGGNVQVKTVNIYPESTDVAVFTVTVKYFVDVDGGPSANTLHWAFELSR